MHNQDLAGRTGLDPGRLSDAVRILEDSGYAQAIRTLGNAPFDFNGAWITAAGRLELERASAAAQESKGPTSELSFRPTPQPVGSPYGFKPEDWEHIDLERGAAKLIVVFGHQFESEYYDSTELEAHLREDFSRALAAAQEELPTGLVLDFVPLRAGYGEHLFNHIARSIIASDIAVFETSDLNPNVMIEMGVALTWGIRGHPIRHLDAPEPPTDISGQTWARYKDNGTIWEQDDHFEKLVAMTKLAARKKASSQ